MDKLTKHHTIKNNILLFSRGPFSQWFGSFKNQPEGQFTMPVESFYDFIPWELEGIYAKEFEQEDIHSTMNFNFQCAECAMMFGKSVAFGDIDTARKILDSTSAAEQQKLGRQVKNFDQKYWDTIKLPLVSQINYHKFRQNPTIADLLCVKYKHYIIAEATDDPVYGIGFFADDERAWNVATWQGENLLGEVLMQVRRQLQSDKNYE